MKKVAVTIDDLVFNWGDDTPCLSIPKFELYCGEKVFIKGPSGSGKSTLLNMLGGVLLPETGGIRVLEHDYSTMRASQLDRFRADHIGFIFQQFNLLPFLSLLDNVCLPCRFSAKRRARAIEEFGSVEQGAEALLARLGLAEASLYQKDVAALSVGQQQRVSAARAILGAPEIIIADEPTSALDTESRDQFLALLLSQCELSGSTLIFVSHDSSLEHHFSQRAQLMPSANGGYSL